MAAQPKLDEDELEELVGRDRGIYFLPHVEQLRKVAEDQQELARTMTQEVETLRESVTRLQAIVSSIGALASAAGGGPGDVGAVEP